jgi:NAD(P)-dependent dehydrogenase (short-subunit alcohol dehydrogenase family)
MPTTILITGANRGLGLEFVRQYAKDGCKVYATCRHPATADDLQALQQKYPNIQICQLDTTSSADLAALTAKISDPIDILINNAGLLLIDPSWGKLTIDTMEQSFLVNAVAPLKVTEAFTKHVSSSTRKLVVCVSSSMGSIQENTSGGYYSYRASKTALNMFMKSAARDLSSQGIQILLLHPGWVKTRMGGDSASITPEESVTGMRQVIENYQSSPGEVTFYRYNGTLVPW